MAVQRLFDLPWEHILCRHVLPHFNMRELFYLRGISAEFRDLVDYYFSLCLTVDTGRYASLFSNTAFDVLMQKNNILKKLVLTNASDWLLEASLMSVLQNNPNLQTIDLSYCYNLTNACVYTIGTHCKMVQKISLRGCVLISGSGLLSFINNRAPLEDVDLSGCCKITDDDLINLVAHCTVIKFLHLNNMKQLTDRCVGGIARQCRDLTHLGVTGCCHLTNQSMLHLAEFCPSLKSLEVKGIQGITDVSLARLRAKQVFVDKCKPLHDNPGLHLQI